MFIISRISPDGTLQLRGEATTTAIALEDIASALELLKTLPQGVKIEISYTADSEEETE